MGTAHYYLYVDSDGSYLADGIEYPIIVSARTLPELDLKFIDAVKKYVKTNGPGNQKGCIREVVIVG